MTTATITPAKISGEKWFVFTAYNTESHFGFGTDEEANRYCDNLNRDREINVYSFFEITDADALANLDSGEDTDGFELALALDTQTEHDEWRAAEQRRMYGDPTP